MSDWVVFSALICHLSGHAPSAIFTFENNQFIDAAAEIMAARALSLAFSEFDSALGEGRPDTADVIAGLLRKQLLAYTGKFSADLYTKAGWYRLLYQAYRDRFLINLPDTASRRVYSKKNQLEAWLDFFKTIDPAAPLAAIGGWTEMSSDVARLKNFYDDGLVALSQDEKEINRNRPPPLTTLLWLSAFCVRAAEYYIGIGDGAAAISMTIRVLENYLDLKLYELGVFEYEYSDRELRLTPVGASRYLAVRAAHGSGVKAGLFVLHGYPGFSSIDVDPAAEAIQLRNRAVFAHGVQRLSVLQVGDALSDIKSFISRAEAVTPAVGSRWKGMVSDSFVLDWTAVRLKTFAALA